MPLKLELNYSTVDSATGATTHIYAKSNGELVIKTTAPKQRRTASPGGAKASGIGKAPKNTLGNGLHKPSKHSAAASHAAQVRHAGRHAAAAIPDGAPRCVVKLTLCRASKKGRVLHARNMKKHGQVFNGSNKPGNAEAEEVVAAWSDAGDPYLFKLIVSPEHRLTAPQLQELAWAGMGELAQQLNVGGLDWLGVACLDTSHPHIQIVWRGKSERKPGVWQEFKLSPRTMCVGLREIFRTKLIPLDSAQSLQY